MMDHTKRIRVLSASVLLAVTLFLNLVVIVSFDGREQKPDAGAASDAASAALPSEVADDPVSSEEPLSQEQLDEIHELTKNIILYYGCYGSKADAKVEELLEELRGIDEKSGELWQRIMDYWKKTNAGGLQVNYKAVPQGLPDGDNLCIVVLGYELKSDGGIKYELSGRLKAALKCIEQYPNAPVVCTGGGTAADNPDVTEAGQMVQWLIDNGVDENRLIKEDKSVSTVENAIFSYDILTRDYPHVDSVLLVSSRYHFLWSDLVFETAFMKRSEENGTPMINVVSNYAFNTEHRFFKSSQKMRWQTGGMLELIGENDLMEAFYSDKGYWKFMRNSKPKL